MNMTPFNILIVVAMILSICGMIRPQWPLVATAVLLLAVALLIK